MGSQRFRHDWGTFTFTCKILMCVYINTHICIYLISKHPSICFNTFVAFLDFLTLQSIQFSRSVLSSSLQPHELQHARPPCPSPTPGVYPNPCPSSRWCHPAISSSVAPFSSCPQSLPASGSFPMNQLFTWGSQSIGVSASASVLPMNTQDWSHLGWTGWISLQPKELSRVFSNTTVQNLTVISCANNKFHLPCLYSYYLLLVS